MNRIKFLRVRRFITFVSAIVIVAGLAFLIQSNSGRIRRAKSVLKVPTTDKSSITRSDKQGFDALLATASAEQLPKMLRDLADDRNLEPVERLDRMQKRVEVMDRILIANPNEKARNYAISSKLATLMNREFVLVENDLVMEGHSAKLQEFADQHRLSNNISISNSAMMALAAAAFSEFLRAESPDKRSELSEAAVEQLRLAAIHEGHDVSSAHRLHDWLQLIRANCEKSESQLFFYTFVKSYENSDIVEIAGLAAQVRRKMEESEIELIDVSDSLPADREEAIGQLLVQVDTELNRSDVSESIKLYVLSRANDLLKFGRTDEALTIRQKLENSTKKGTTGELQSELAKFDQRMKLFQMPFDVSGLTDFNSNPAKFSNASARHRLLFFSGGLNVSESINELNELVKSVQGELLNSNLELVVVYIERDDSLEALKDVKTFAGMSVHWQVWHLKAATKEGQAFLDRVPIGESPYIVVLGKNDHAVALNPSIVEIEKMVFTK